MCSVSSFLSKMWYLFKGVQVGMIPDLGQIRCRPRVHNSQQAHPTRLTSDPSVPEAVILSAPSEDWTVGITRCPIQGFAVLCHQPGTSTGYNCIAGLDRISHCLISCSLHLLFFLVFHPSACASICFVKAVS